MWVQAQIVVRFGPVDCATRHDEVSFCQALLNDIRRILGKEGLVAEVGTKVRASSRLVVVSNSGGRNPMIELVVGEIAGRVHITLRAAVVAASRQAKPVLARRRQISELTALLAEHASAMPGIDEIAFVGVSVGEGLGARLS